MPTSTSLVTNLPADFNTFGQAVDTSMAQLKGGSTGQVLSKTSSTDMAFTWVTPTDQTPLTTKGDLFTYSTADARLAVGNNGETLVADSSASTGLRYQGSMAAGKNAVIGGSFDIWQRGTASTTSQAAYTGADRWFTFTLTNANSAQVTLAAGSPCTYGVKFTSTSATNSVLYGTALESQTLDPLRGQTVTLSFYAYCSTGTVSLISYVQKNATPNTLQSGTWTTVSSPTNTVTTTPTRFSATFAIAGDSTTAGLRILFGADNFTNGANFVIYGVQLEVGSVATQFTRAGGTIQGELAACQRYYYRQGGLNTYQTFGGGFADQTTTAIIQVPLPATMRVAPTSVDFSTLNLSTGGTNTAVTSLTILSNNNGNGIAVVYPVVASGLTANRPYSLTANNSTNGFLGLSAEL